MNKIWAFVEGDSEKAFVINLLRKTYYNKIKLIKDLSFFIKEKPDIHNFYYFYCENCNSVDRIPHQINKQYYQIKMSKSKTVFIICDIEKLKCNSIRKKEIEHRLESFIEKSYINYIFFNPKIESLYWNCPQIIKRVIELSYRDKFNKRKKITIPAKYNNCLNDLKVLFKKNGLKYSELKFAKAFFPRIHDFRKCNNQVVKRIIKLLDIL